MRQKPRNVGLTCTLSSETCNKIASILMEHPCVMYASIVDEEGPTRQRYSVAYVVPSPERMEAANSRTYLEGRDKRINQWQTIFDQTYRFRHGDDAPNFVGWRNSYTNEAIPQIEMQEWLDGTIERVGALRPERVLEIGCGVGLLVETLSPRCRAYCGTDLSPVATSRLREFVGRRPNLRHVELVEREAINFDGLAPGSVDLVVLNSVVQYFPEPRLPSDRFGACRTGDRLGSHLCRRCAASRAAADVSWLGTVCQGPGRSEGGVA